MAWKLSCLAATAALAIASAQGPKYGLGRPASEDDAKAIGAAVTPDGRGLPAGSGTAEQGREVYEVKCKECHGPEGQGSDQTALVGKLSDLDGPNAKRTVGSYWPYATTLWDYVNRAMPFDQPGTLTHDQVYAVTAYVLHLNGLIPADQTIDAESLPKVEMPNRNGFIPDPRPGSGMKK